jgi:hypothetical protein
LSADRTVGMDGTGHENARWVKFDAIRTTGTTGYR